MEPVQRVTLADHALTEPLTLGHVEVRRITMAPSTAAGTHTHNGPVFGVIETGSVDFQVGDEPATRLRQGDTFYEPSEQPITRFDATTDGVTFLAWFPLPADATPEIR